MARSHYMTAKDWAKVNAEHVEGLIAHGFMTEEEHYNDWVEEQAAWHDQEAMQDIEDEHRYPFYRHF